MKLGRLAALALAVSAVLFVLSGLTLYATLSQRPVAVSSDADCKFGTLTELANKYHTDKGTVWPTPAKANCVTDLYECFFYPIKYEARKICEIGVAEGASMKMFRDYFPNATIYGIDINRPRRMDMTRFKLFIADQGDRRQLKNFTDDAGDSFDIILDDGGHAMSQQQISFGYLFKFVKPGGYYIIEDICTSFYGPVDGAAFGVEPDEKNTTVAMVDKFLRTGKIESKYMTPEERDYAAANIEYCNLWGRNEGKAATCIIKKK